MKISLISANMWLLPPPFSVENRKRIDSFSSMVRKCKADIVCIQEVWLNWDLKYLRNKFSDYQFIAKPDLLYNKTGLVVFSKHSPLQFEKKTFSFNKSSALYDMLGRKGYMLCKFHINKRTLSIINVHLDSPISKNQIEAWKNQYDEIRKIIQASGNSIVLVGDLNGPLGKLSKHALPTTDLGGGVKSFSKNNPYNKRGFHKFTQSIERFDLDIDQAILFSKNGEGSLTKRLILDPVVSDHYPIQAEITLL